MVTVAEDLGGIKLERRYDLTAPRGVAGRNSDNTFIKQVLGWEPGTSIRDGLRPTYQWIEEQYQARKSGQRTVQDVY